MNWNQLAQNLSEKGCTTDFFKKRRVETATDIQMIWGTKPNTSTVIIHCARSDKKQRLQYLNYDIIDQPFEKVVSLVEKQSTGDQLCLPA